MYLTEVSPINLRGMLGSVHQLLVTISILFSQILGLPFIFGNENYWPLIFGMLHKEMHLTIRIFSFHRRSGNLPTYHASIVPRITKVQPDR